jgi:hypothetical protein
MIFQCDLLLVYKYTGFFLTIFCQSIVTKFKMRRCMVRSLAASENGNGCLTSKNCGFTGSLFPPLSHPAYPRQWQISLMLLS